MLKAVISLLSGIFLGACTMVGIRTSAEPSFQILTLEGSIEIRQYPAIIVAETRLEGDYATTGSEGFKRLAGYIFGDNQPKSQITMTTPVFRETAGESMAMTAPVLQQPDGKQWLMSFVMPENYTLDTLPRPNNADITIKQVPAKKVAVLAYSGSLNAEKISEKATELLAWLQSHHYKILSQPRSAAYDPPWTIPALRRNEIHIDIE